MKAFTLIPVAAGIIAAIGHNLLQLRGIALPAAYMDAALIAWPISTAIAWWLLFVREREHQRHQERQSSLAADPLLPMAPCSRCVGGDPWGARKYPLGDKPLVEAKCPMCDLHHAIPATRRT